jgi:outer membrane biosynthesis protein TonB
MKKDDYKNDFEENRKDIKMDEDALPSRMEKYGKNRKVKKKSGNLTINVILGLFTLIPVIILIYVISDFYAPSPGITAGVSTGEVTIETGKADKGSINKEKENINSSATSDKKDDKTTGTTSASKPAVNVNPSTGSGKEQASKPETKPEIKPEAKPEAKPETKPETKPQATPTPKPETKPVVTPKPKPVTKPEAKPVSKTHTVASNENLYRIALKYYGNGSDATVAKLRAANGLGTNEIRVGQKIIIP